MEDGGDEGMDMLVLAGVPEEVRTAVNAMVVDQRAGFLASHPQARDIAAIVGMHRLDSRTGRSRMSWAEMAIGLNRDFPGLDATGPKLRLFCERVLDPMLVIPAGYARRALLDATGELNTAKSLLDLREKALAAIEKLKDTVGDVETYETDSGVKGVVKTGPSLSEYTKALKDAGDLTTAFAREAARFGLMPETRQERGGLEVSVSVDLRGGGRMGRAMGGQAVDAEFKAV